MENILKTRKTVKQYVRFNITFFSLLMISGMVHAMFFSDTNPSNPELIGTKWWLFILIAFLFTGIFIGVFALFYRIVYGILTNRLKENYKELEKIEL